MHPGLIILFPRCYLLLEYIIIGSFINCQWFPLVGAGGRLHIMAARWSDSEYGRVFIQFGSIVVFDETVTQNESSEDVESLMATLHGFERVLPTWC